MKTPLLIFVVSLAFVAGMSQFYGAAPAVASSKTTTPITQAIDVSVGNVHSCAVVQGSSPPSNNTVWCWGANNGPFAGELGDGTMITRPTAVQVRGVGGIGYLMGATQVSAGVGHTCALVQGSNPPNDNAVYCWGFNHYGELGTVLPNIPPAHGLYSTTPVKVNITKPIQVSAGIRHTCALVQGTTTAQNTVRCWGWNSVGQLGIGPGGPGQTPSPTEVKAINNADGFLQGVKQISAGNATTCAVVAAAPDYAVCWGGNLGNLTAATKPYPVRVYNIVGVPPLKVKAISAGYGQTCAILAAPNNNNVACWGGNSWGELGIGNFATPKLRPVLVHGLDNVGPPLLALPTGVRAGDWRIAGTGHSCAPLAAGMAACWGRNWAGGDGPYDGGQLGDGTWPNTDSTGKRNFPKYVLATTSPATKLTNVVALSAGEGNTCAIVTGRKIKCWGRNESGELGNGGMNGPIPTSKNVADKEPLYTFVQR